MRIKVLSLVGFAVLVAACTDSGPGEYCVGGTWPATEPPPTEACEADTGGVCRGVHAWQCVDGCWLFLYDGCGGFDAGM